MTPEEYLKKMQSFMQSLPNEMAKIVLSEAMTLKSKVQRRIQETGTAWNGAPLKPYSKGYAAFKKALGRYKGHVDFTLGQWSVTALQKSRNKKAKSSGKSKPKPTKMIPKNGPQLWSSVRVFQPISQIEGGGGQNIIVRVTVPPDDSGNMEKAMNIEKKWGNFLRLSGKEQKEASDNIKNKIAELIKANIGSSK